MFKIFTVAMFIRAKHWEKFKTLSIIKSINCGELTHQMARVGLYMNNSKDTMLTKISKSQNTNSVNPINKVQNRTKLSNILLRDTFNK